jgi:Tfp pilus assembly protein PilO
MSISPRNRLIATIIVAAVIVIALVAGLIVPQLQWLGSLNAQVGEATARANAAKLQLAQRQAFKDRAIDTNAKWLRLMNQVPDNPDLPAFIIELQDAAFKSGVQLMTVTPSAPAPKPTFAAVPVNVEVVGSWSDTIDYLESLMVLDRGVRLVNVNTKVTPSGRSDIQNESLPPYAVDSVIGLETYLIPSATATSAPAAAPVP